MSSGRFRSAATAVLAVLGLLAVVGVGTWRPVEPVPPPEALAVGGSTELVCPVPAGAAADLTVVAPGAGLDQVDVVALDGDPVPGLQTGPELLTGRVGSTVLVQARGEAARAVAGVLTRTGAGSEDPGLSQVGCQPATAGRWLVGLADGGEQQAAVVLTNPDDRQAVVNLAVHDEEGLRPAPGSRDLTVPARSTRVVDLAPLVESTGRIAVQVQATTGRVLALGRQRSFTDARPAASEWLTGTAEPAAEQVLPGVPGGSGARQLVLLNPGERRAEVQVEALGAEGGYVPAGVSGPLDVPPGGTATLTLDDGFSEEATTLRVSGSQPVTATLAAADDDGDLALVPATDPITGSAVGVARSGAGQDAAPGELVVGNAGPDPARALVHPLTGDGEPTEVAIPPGSSRVVSGADLGRVEVLAGRLHVAAVLGTGGLSSLPLLPTGSAADVRVPQQDPRLR